MIRVIYILGDILREESLLTKKVNSVCKTNPTFESALNTMFKWMEKNKKVKIEYQGILPQADYEDGKLYKVYRTRITKGKYEAIREVDKVLIDIAPSLEISIRCLCGEVLMSIKAVIEAKKQRLAVN
jgi:hypothetical protein